MTDALQQQFLDDLPKLERVAKFRLRRLEPEAREEAVAETIALCWQAYVRLIERGKGLDVIERFANKTAEFAAKRVLCNRPLTGSRSREALNLPRGELHSDDARVASSVPELVALRVDFESWLATLRPNRQEVIRLLESGLNTVEVGEQRGVTGGAVSNMRMMLRRQWNERFGQV